MQKYIEIQYFTTLVVPVYFEPFASFRPYAALLVYTFVYPLQKERTAISLQSDWLKACGPERKPGKLQRKMNFLFTTQFCMRTSFRSIHFSEI